MLITKKKKKKKKRTQKDYILTSRTEKQKLSVVMKPEVRIQRKPKKKNPNPFLCRTLTENQQDQYWEDGTDQRESHCLPKA